MRLVGEAGPVQRGEQPVAGAVAGEDPPGPVAAVGRRREADHHQPRARVAEARQRARPVALALVAARRVGRDGLAPRDQPRAAAARLDLGGERVERPSRALALTSAVALVLGDRPQPRERAPDQPRDVHLRDADALGDLGLRHVLDEAQVQDQALARR